MTPLREIPRHATHLGLTLARVPLSATEALLGRRGDEAWPPALAFERAGGMVKEVVGSVLSDDDLREEGQLATARVDQLRRATTLHAAAEVRAEAAHDEVEERRAEAAKRRRDAARLEKERKQAIAQKAKEEEHAAAERARIRTEASEQAQEAATDAVLRRARRDRQAAIAEEDAALSTERAAMTEREQAAALDQGVKAQKAKRAAPR